MTNDEVFKGINEGKINKLIIKKSRYNDRFAKIKVHGKHGRKVTFVNDLEEFTQKLHLLDKGIEVKYKKGFDYLRYGSMLGIPILASKVIKIINDRNQMDKI